MDNYRFGFNGQEKLNEIAGIENHNTALHWELDTFCLAMKIKVLGNLMHMWKITNKVIFIIGVMLLIIVYLFYRHDKCMPIVSNLYYSLAKVKDMKYGYFLKNGEYEPLLFIYDCEMINDMQAYYTGKSSSIDFSFGLLQPFRKYEVLDYYPSDSTAVIRIYNSIPRLNRIGSVIVSMHCLHDTLPEGKEELVGW